MAGVLSIISNFSYVNQGVTHTGKQGLAADDFLEALDITTTGPCYIIPFLLPTATVRTFWDEDSNFPVDFDHGYIWADGKIYVQLIGSATNFTMPVAATVPFWIPGFDELLAAANTTPITGGTEPTMETIDSIAIGNYTGSNVNGMLVLID